VEYRVVVTISLPDALAVDSNDVAEYIEDTLGRAMYYVSSPWDLLSVLPLRPPVAR
jgi:hypothetical protein